ncbi:MAG: toll/interleukin-1 receptor domain-containing protein [Anaerolineae bacterium]
MSEFVVITEPRTLYTDTEALERCLKVYFKRRYSPAQLSVYSIGGDNETHIEYHAPPDGHFSFVVTDDVDAKLTITRMTYPRHWKDDFEELMEAMPRQWLSTQYYTCFMSHSSKDQAFAERLHADLQDKGVHCWFAPEDMKIGDRIRPAIDRAIQSYDRLLLVLSEHSIDSDWVEKEVETAFEEERKWKKTILLPIRLDSAVMDTDQAWAADIRRTRHIGDFSRWQDHDAYQKAFERLLRDLKAEEVAEADT